MTADKNLKSIPVSAIIFTLNEEIHLPDCLRSVGEFDDVIVVDSFSTDRTKEICDNAGVRFIQHSFEGFGMQRNWALEHGNPKHDWVLILDADERVSQELSSELRELMYSIPTDVSAYRLKRRFYLWGKWLKHSGDYPVWLVRLVNKHKVRYVNRGHAETQTVNGKTANLRRDLIDENKKGIDEWVERQNRYSRQEAEYELYHESKVFKIVDLCSMDPVKQRANLKVLSWHIPFRPFFYFMYSYIWHLGFLDGVEGFIFCMMKAFYQTMIVAKKYELRHKSRASGG